LVFGHDPPESSDRRTVILSRPLASAGFEKNSTSDARPPPPPLGEAEVEADAGGSAGAVLISPAEQTGSTRALSYVTDVAHVCPPSLEIDTAWVACGSGHDHDRLEEVNAHTEPESNDRNRNGDNQQAASCTIVAALGTEGGKKGGRKEGRQGGRDRRDVC
jgi:hypothetical protein